MRRSYKRTYGIERSTWGIHWDMHRVGLGACGRGVQIIEDQWLVVSTAERWISLGPKLLYITLTSNTQSCRHGDEHMYTDTDNCSKRQQSNRAVRGSFPQASAQLISFPFLFVLLQKTLFSSSEFQSLILAVPWPTLHVYVYTVYISTYIFWNLKCTSGYLFVSMKETAYWCWQGSTWTNIYSFSVSLILKY